MLPISQSMVLSQHIKDASGTALRGKRGVSLSSALLVSSSAPLSTLAHHIWRQPWVETPLRPQSGSTVCSTALSRHRPVKQGTPSLSRHRMGCLGRTQEEAFVKLSPTAASLPSAHARASWLSHGWVCSSADKLLVCCLLQMGVWCLPPGPRA